MRVVNGVNVTTDQNKAMYHYTGSAISDLFGSFGAHYKRWQWLIPRAEINANPLIEQNEL